MRKQEEILEYRRLLESYIMILRKANADIDAHTVGMFDMLRWVCGEDVDSVLNSIALLRSQLHLVRHSIEVTANSASSPQAFFRHLLKNAPTT